MITPEELKKKCPLDDDVRLFILHTREQIKNILSGQDDRLIVVVGPCSIHNVDQAIEYAKGLKEIASKHDNQLLIIMRTYFEKPRTNLGWKGLISDPELNDSCQIEKGLELARNLLISLNKMEVPCSCEFLDILTPHYLSDLISWGCIGARTTESQTHRQMASGLEMPIGFKNGTTGTIKIAVDAILTAQTSHSYLDINPQGTVYINHTCGNPDTHIVLRGGWDGPTIKPNYHMEDIQRVAQLLQYSGLRENIMVDCSHANSKKNHHNQGVVARYLSEHIGQGNTNLIGVMLESNLKSGRQDLDHKNPENLIYGISITDACIDLKETEEIIEDLAVAIKNRRHWFES